MALQDVLRGRAGLLGGKVCDELVEEVGFDSKNFSLDLVSVLPLVARKHS
jgi:hypothetical protein